MDNATKLPSYTHATIKAHIITHNGQDDIQAGERVTIAYRLTAWNQLYRRAMDVYTVTRDNGQQLDVYENALKDFETH